MSDKNHFINRKYAVVAGNGVRVIFPSFRGIAASDWNRLQPNRVI